MPRKGEKKTQKEEKKKFFLLCFFVNVKEQVQQGNSKEQSWVIEPEGILLKNVCLEAVASSLRFQGPSEAKRR